MSDFQYPDSILQSPEWASFKEKEGFGIFKIKDIHFLSRKLLGGRSFLYVPEIHKTEFTKITYRELGEIIQKTRPIFLRVEFLDLAEDFQPPEGFIKAFEEVQPKERLILDLTSSEKDILGQMKPKGRYNIKLAARHGVKVESGRTRQVLSEFYQLYQETARREKITSRSRSYFEKMIDNLAPKDYIDVFIAHYQEKPLSSALVIFYKETATYLYGGSSREQKELMAPYLVQWAAICEAQERGCKIYDLGGVGERWPGLTRFKEQFGGKKIEIAGSYDRVYQPGWYRVFRAIEKMRRK